MTWAVAISAPQAERKAVESVRGCGLEVFYPRLKHKIMRRGRKVLRIDPLFPRYFFVFVQDAWRILLSAQHVVGVVQTKQGPAIVPEKVIDFVKARCDRDGFFIDEGKKRFERFRKGSFVRVKTGLLTGFIGVYQGMSPHQRETALFDLLGRNVRVEFAEGDLVAA